jgi:amylosucrase
MRISGTTASLAGLEQARTINESGYIDSAIKRILLIYSIAMSAGGIPLIYLGDEIATLNDYTYQNDPTKAEDSRWVHRTTFDWTRAKLRTDLKTAEGRIFKGLTELIKVRKATPELAGGQALFFENGNGHVLSFVRSNSILVLANFSEQEQTVSINTIRARWPRLVTGATNLITAQAQLIGETLLLKPHTFLWLKVT